MNIPINHHPLKAEKISSETDSSLTQIDDILYQHELSLGSFVTVSLSSLTDTIIKSASNKSE